MPDTFNPDMLLLARQYRAISQADLADRVKGVLNQPRLSRIENGLYAPSDEELNALARALSMRTEFFFHSVRRRPSTAAYHRKRQKLSQTDWARIYARAEIYRLMLGLLLRSVDVDTKRTLPPYRDPEDANGRVEDIARDTRQFWMLPRGPVTDLTRVIESAGIVVIPYDFGTDLIDGFGQHKNEEIPPLIFVNTRQPKDKLRFTLAHEIGHLIMHRMPNPEMESQANRFAAEFLMPTEDIRPSLHSFSIERFIDLKLYWKTSIQALVRKARDIGKMDERRYRYYNYEISRRGMKRNEPGEITDPIEVPQLFKQLIRTHVTGLSYAPEEFSKLFGLHIAELDKDYLPSPPKLKLVAG
jgi:Zn-dependent peptidase ImmA (M78 family)/transcriptional regulator with XRE-family HTH domain